MEVKSRAATAKTPNLSRNLEGDDSSTPNILESVRDVADTAVGLVMTVAIKQASAASYRALRVYDTRCEGGGRGAQFLGA